jgi:hypothetical protein
MLHHGYRVEGDPNHELHFYRPDGTYLGSTSPATTAHPRSPRLGPKVPGASGPSVREIGNHCSGSARVFRRWPTRDSQRP